MKRGMEIAHQSKELPRACLRLLRSEVKRFMINWISVLWCKKMHTKAMWPIHGRYICPQCLRTYPVVWEEPAIARTGPINSAKPQTELQHSTVSLYQ
jgi:hypothetical protein